MLGLPPVGGIFFSTVIMPPSSNTSMIASKSFLFRIDWASDRMREMKEGHLMSATPIYLVMDAGTPVSAFTSKHELKVYLRRRLDVFVNPLVYTFWGNQGPSIMTIAAPVVS
jgi:hypothetical protein